MELLKKLEILADAAKYDVACTSSGIDRAGVKGQLGAAGVSGCCHSFTADGRCVSLLKVLMTNSCVFDCAYCSSRVSNTDTPRACFSPRELADLTIEFYRRNYIEGLFLSSGVLKSPDNTTELMIKALSILRNEYGFRGYIHAKAVPGTSPELIHQLGLLADRLSVNLEMPSEESLKLMCPQKTRQSVMSPMHQISETIQEHAEMKQLAKKRRTVYMSSDRAFTKIEPFAPAGQSTQMIVGATPESDYQILALAASLYEHFLMKRVFFSAYIPVVDDVRLPRTDHIQLNREHRLYQADWLLRFYGFNVGEIIDEDHPFLETGVDPKANWALNHLDLFPVDVNTCTYEMLLRVPGIGVRGAKLIIRARRQSTLGELELKKMGIAYKRARYFITCKGKYMGCGINFNRETLLAKLASSIDGGSHGRRADKPMEGQMSLFETTDDSGRLLSDSRSLLNDSGRLLNSSDSLSSKETLGSESLFGLKPATDNVFALAG